MNTITIDGNLTREPELRFTQSGRPVAAMGVANNRRFQVNGEWKEEVTFFNVTCWGELAENVAASFGKGDRVIVAGRMQSREYDKDGDKRTAWDLVADEVGASLRFATVSVSRRARTQADPSSPIAGTTTERPANAAPAPQQGAMPVYGEEPFLSIGIEHEHSYRNMLDF